MSTLSSANVTDVNLVLKQRTRMRLCINMRIFTHNLGNWLIIPVKKLLCKMCRELGPKYMESLECFSRSNYLLNGYNITKFLLYWRPPDEGINRSIYLFSKLK